MATFSWADTARAVFGSCLPCLPSSRPAHTPHDSAHATRRDELESLLQGAEFTDTENDADALSLHSHIGQHDGRKRVKKKRTKHKGSITLFGFDLFGRPLASPEDAEDDERNARRRISRISTSTIDSDAAPLADDAIAELSSQVPEQRAADEARRARKRLRKLQKEAARLDTHGNAFEGFPGSGALQEQTDDFGAFQQAPVRQESAPIDSGNNDIDEADAEGDFDAGSYVRSARPRSDSGSGTRSRTSASSSRPHPHPHPHLVPLPPSSAGSAPTAPFPSAPAPAPKPKRAKKPKSGTRSSATVSSSTTASQPRSPTSPVSPPPHVEIATPHDAAFEGVPHDADELSAAAPVPKRTRGIKLTGETVHGEEQPFAIPDFPSPGLSRSSGFPSPGLGRAGGGFPSPGLGGRKNSLQGAFLARTGEDA